MRVLRCRPAGIVILGLVIDAERGTRLHRIRHEAVVDEVERGDMGGRCDGLVDGLQIADFPVIDLVARRVVVDLRRTRFQGIDSAGDSRQDVVIDLDRLGGVTRLGLGVGDNDRHRIADIAHLLVRQRAPVAHIHRRTVLGVDHPAANQRTDPIRRHFGAGQNTDHARHLLRLGGIDALDHGVSMRRTDECRMFHARDGHVVRIAALASDESLVFLARHAGADAFHSHEILPWVGSD